MHDTNNLEFGQYNDKDLRAVLHWTPPVLAAWRELEHRPHFMSHLVRVTELGNGRSHWVAKGPAGINVEWDAEIINEVPTMAERAMASPR